jgi:hypothetical protein
VGVLGKRLHVTELGPGRYSVAASEPRTVEVHRDVARCSCPDHVYRKRACKHIRAVWEFLHLAPAAAAAGPGLERDVPGPDAAP